MKKILKTIWEVIYRYKITILIILGIISILFLFLTVVASIQNPDIKDIKSFEVWKYFIRFFLVTLGYGIIMAIYTMVIDQKKIIIKVKKRNFYWNSFLDCLDKPDVTLDEILMWYDSLKIDEHTEQKSQTMARGILWGWNHCRKEPFKEIKSFETLKFED